MQNKSEILKGEDWNPFKDFFETPNEDMIPTVQKSTILDLDSFQKEVLDNKDSELTALDKKINRSLSGKLKRKNSKFVSEDEFKNPNLDNESLKKLGIISDKDKNMLIIREMPKISQEQYDKMEKAYLNSGNNNNNILQNLYNHLNNVNCNFRNPNCYNSVGGINPLTYLIEVSFQMSHKRQKEMKEKFELLSKYMVNYREINSDGNCYYRAVMFRYIEILILTENIPVFQNFIHDIIESFKSSELQSRRIIRNSDVKPDLTFQILFLIINLLKSKKVQEAHQIFVKCISTCKKFDYCLILYFRYILYQYIKLNEKKTLMEKFPVKIGNLLPQQYENEKGEFLFELFYENYLLNFFTDAEKIIIYLTPFVLGIEVNVIVYDIVDEEIFQKFEWVGESDIKSKDVISLLNNKNHYAIVYNDYDNNTYKKIYEFYKSNIKSVILMKSLAPRLMNYEMDDNNSVEKDLIHQDDNGNNINNNLNEIKQKENNKNKNDNNKNKIIDKKENNNNEKSNDINQNKNINMQKNNMDNNIKNFNNNEINARNKINQNIIMNNNHINIDNNIYNIKNTKEKNVNNININDNKNNNDSLKNNHKNINQNLNKNEKLKEENKKNINDMNQKINSAKAPKKVFQNKDNNEIILSDSRQLKNNIDNNEIEDKKNLKINQINNKNEKIDNKINAQTNIIIHKKNKQERNKTPEELKKNKNIQANENIKKIQNKEIKEIKTHRAYNNCDICKTKIKPNDENPYCKKCFKLKLIIKYYQCFQNNLEPTTNIYFHLKEKKIDLEEIIKLYNRSYDDSIDYGKILENIKEKKCILCPFKNTIPLPCSCDNCKYCVHLPTYFNNTELKTGFYCPNRVRYDREKMFKLGKLLFKFQEKDIDSSAVIKYFKTRLISNCCLCGVNLINKKYEIKLYDLNKDEYANKFLSIINHYICGECAKRKLHKEFKCQICQVYHIDKME